MKNQILPIFLILLALTSYYFTASMSNAVQAQTSVQNSTTISAAKVAIIIGNDTTDHTPLLQIKRILENKGLLYQVLSDRIQNLNETYSAIIILGATGPELEGAQQLLGQQIENQTGILWISSGLPKALYPIFGLSSNTTTNKVSDITAIGYGQLKTQVFNETLDIIAPKEATVEGYFIDSNDHEIAPAELSLKYESGASAQYFAYDVCSWWSADLQTPWLRAYRLDKAIDNALANHFTVSLAPYPRNLKSVFITRIEDVDPLHTSQEWLSRANLFLDYATLKGTPLTVSLIPRYVNPQLNTTIELSERSATELRNWLSATILRGGSIIQHGFTHQIGEGITGVSAEFYINESKVWLSFDEQKQRINVGKQEIGQTLGSEPLGFEAPHYIANNDTYKAVYELGFKYTTHNTDTPFVDTYYGLINVPETLGYLPLDVERDAESGIKSNMDMLYNMSGVMLYFNHLFDDSALEVGENLIEYASSKKGTWTTNLDQLAEFAIQRQNAYQEMEIATQENKLIVTLGSSNKAGLTISISGTQKIKAVTVNGQQWPIFSDNYIILPELPISSNVIIIELQKFRNETNNIGYFVFAVSLVTSSLLLLQAIVSHKPIIKLWRKDK